MITKKQWKKIVNYVQKYIIDYDFYIKNERVINCDIIGNTIATHTKGVENSIVIYKHPNSFNNIKNYNEIMEKIECKPKLHKMPPPNLKCLIKGMNGYN